MAAFQDSEGMLRAARTGFINTHPSLVHKQPDSMRTWSHASSGQAASSASEDSHVLTNSDLGLPDARFTTTSSGSARLQLLAPLRSHLAGERAGYGASAGGSHAAPARGWGSEDGGGYNSVDDEGAGEMEGERTSAPAILSVRTRPSSATMRPTSRERPIVLARPASAGTSRTPATPPAPIQAPTAGVPAASHKLRSPGVLPQQIAAGRVVEAPWRLAALQHPAQQQGVQGAAGALPGAYTLTPLVAGPHHQPSPHNSELLEAIKHGPKAGTVHRDVSLSSSSLSTSGSHHFAFTSAASRDGSMSGDMLGLQPRPIHVQPRAAAIATTVTVQTAALQQQQEPQMQQHDAAPTSSCAASQSFPGFGSTPGAMNSTPRLGPGAVQRANTMGELGQQVAAGVVSELWVPSGAVPGMRPSSTGAAGAGSLLDDFAAAHDLQHAHGALPPGPLPHMQPRPPSMGALGHRPAPRMRALSDSGTPQGSTINLAPLPLPANSLGGSGNLKHLVLLKPAVRHMRTHRYSAPGNRVEEGGDDSSSSSGEEGEAGPSEGGPADGKVQGSTAGAGAGAAAGAAAWHSHVSTSLDAHGAVSLDTSASPAWRRAPPTTTPKAAEAPAPVTYLRGSWDSDVTASVDAPSSAAVSASEESPPSALLLRPQRGNGGARASPPANPSSGAMGLLRGGDALRSDARTSMRSLPLKALAGSSAGASTATSPPSTTPGSPLTPFSRRL